MTVRACGRGVSAMGGLRGGAGRGVYSGHRRDSHPGGPAAGPPVPLAAPRLPRPPPQMRLQPPSPPPLPPTPPSHFLPRRNCIMPARGLGSRASRMPEIFLLPSFSPLPPPSWSLLPFFSFCAQIWEGGICCCRN